MATVVERDVEQAWLQRRREATRWVVILPLIFGVFALAAPTFSLRWALFVAAASIVAVVVHGLFRARRGYVSRAATALYSTFQVDLMCLFATVFAWRLTHSAWWVLGVLIAIVAGVAVIGLVWRRVVLQEIFAPHGRLGAVLGGLAGGSAAGGGALGYTLGRGAGGWAVAATMLVIACYAALARQALWLKVEEPGWEPVSRR